MNTVTATTQAYEMELAAYQVSRWTCQAGKYAEG